MFRTVILTLIISAILVTTAMVGFGVEINVATSGAIKSGDYVTVTGWKSKANPDAHKDSVLKVLSVDKNLIFVQIVMDDSLFGRPIKFIIDTDNAGLRKLSDEFVHQYKKSLKTQKRPSFQHESDIYEPTAI